MTRDDVKNAAALCESLASIEEASEQVVAHMQTDVGGLAYEVTLFFGDDGVVNGVTVDLAEFHDWLQALRAKRVEQLASYGVDA